MAKVLGLIALLSLIYGASATDPQPTGQLISIGNRKLHIHCTGTGSPTVVVENGGAAFSFDWALVQSEVARFTRICTYDRAGYAWSDPGPEFDTFDQATQDLHLLLMNADVRGPYVLVGHSLGGMLIRFYQAKYPNDVVGMVLVDSSHEDSLQHVGLKVVRIPELNAKQFQALIDEAKANRPKNPEPDLVPTTIFPPYGKLPLFCLSWKWRKRSSVKIMERTYEERAQALLCGREGCGSEAASFGQSASFGTV